MYILKLYRGQMCGPLNWRKLDRKLLEIELARNPDLYVHVLFRTHHAVDRT